MQHVQLHPCYCNPAAAALLLRPCCSLAVALRFPCHSLAVPLLRRLAAPMLSKMQWTPCPRWQKRESQRQRRLLDCIKVANNHCPTAHARTEPFRPDPAHKPPPATTCRHFFPIPKFPSLNMMRSPTCLCIALQVLVVGLGEWLRHQNVDVLADEILLDVAQRVASSLSRAQPSEMQTHTVSSSV